MTSLEGRPDRQALTNGSFEGAFTFVEPGWLSGWVRAPGNPTSVVLDVLLDGIAAETLVARRGPLIVGAPEEACQFAIQLAPEQLKDVYKLGVRVANSSEPVGEAVELSSRKPLAGGVSFGEVSWLGGLRVRGALYNPRLAGRTRFVRAFEGGAEIGRFDVDVWREPARGDPVPAGRYGFQGLLPLSLADGLPHLVRFLDDGDRELPGSPQLIVASIGGFSELAAQANISQTGQTQLAAFDDLLPGSLSWGRFDKWQELFPPRTPEPSELPVCVFIVGDGELAQETLASLEGQRHEVWSAVLVASDDARLGFAAEAWDRAIDDARAEDAELVVFVRAGDVLHPTALAHLAEAYRGLPGIGLIYSDAEIREEGGACWPRFKPCFDETRLWAQAYVLDLFAAPLRRIADLGVPAPGSLPEVAVQLGLPIALGELEAIHIPELLIEAERPEVHAFTTHLSEALTRCVVPERDGGVVTGGAGRLYPSLRVRPAGGIEHATIIIPTRDHADLLRACIESIGRFTRAAHDIIVIDNGSVEPSAVSYLRELTGRGTRVLRIEGPFNYAWLNNLAVEEARGDAIVLMNDDVEALGPDWLTALQAELASPSVGAVGAKLLWPGGHVQHGGVVLGPHDGAVHAFNHCHAEDAGYDDLLLVPREVSAVTAACMAVRRADFVSLGGFDEQAFPVNFNDVDLCLRLRAAGLRIIWTPDAVLTHRESASRGRDREGEGRARAAEELRSLRLRWAGVIANDPFYSPNLNRDPDPYTGLALPPRPRIARRYQRPRANGLQAYLR